MCFKFFGVNIKISFLLIIMITLFSLFDKTNTAVCALFAAFIHEFGHIAAAIIVRCSIKEIAFMPFGIRMRMNKSLDLLPTMRKLFIIAAGPAVNLLCFTAIFTLEGEVNDAALIHLITALFNLLPIGTLDGGKILYELLSVKIKTRKTEQICDIISFFVAVLLLLLGAAVLLETGYNISLFVTAVYVAIMIIIRQKRLNLKG